MEDQFSVERLKDIEAAIAKINRFLSGKFFEEFRDNDMLRDAVLRNLGIISEASSRLNGSTKAKAPEVPWTQWVNLGDRLIQSYYEIDERILSEAIATGLPQLAAAAKRISQEQHLSPR